MLIGQKNLKKNGMISAIIDYSDHYAHTDPAIGLLNFLNYSSDDWKKYNHESHYQNRLRHYEYIDIFISRIYIESVNTSLIIFDIYILV